MPGIGHSGSKLANDPGLNQMDGLALVGLHASRALLLLALYKVLVLVLSPMPHEHCKKAKYLNKNISTPPSRMIAMVSTTLQGKSIHLIFIYGFCLHGVQVTDVLKNELKSI